jgi:pyruvate,orthophosphate dikinase
MYSDVVLGSTTTFEESWRSHKEDKGVSSRHRADAPTTGRRRRRIQGSWSRSWGKPFPQDPEEQLWGAIGAVFGSWMNRAPSPIAG